MPPRLVALLAAATVAQLGVAPAAEPGAPAAPTSEARFEALVREIGLLRSDLASLDRRERGLLTDMERLELEAALCAREISKLSLMRGRTRAEIDENKEKLASARRDILAGERLLAGQLRQVYETGRLGEVRMMLALTEPVDVMRAVAYLDVMARRQAVAVEDLRARRQRAEALKAGLSRQALALEELEGQRRSRAAELTGIRSRSAELLTQVRQEREANRIAIAELTRAAEELEQAIVAGYATGGWSHDRPEPAPPDVGKLQGVLEWPVPGVVKVPFGDVRHPKFGTTTPHPGIDIETEPGTPIRAVMGGRVVFSRRFSGYGNTVLVDHGASYLSVYARIAVLDVVEGQEVLPGQKLGVSADQAFDNGPPTVYFEFRREGRAVDPTRWLKRRVGAGGERRR